MTDDVPKLIIIVLASAVGLGYLQYGRKQKHLIAGICGVGLMSYPYLIHGMFWLVVLGMLLLAGPFIIRN